MVFDKLTEKVEVVESRYHKKDIIEGFILNKSSDGDKGEEEIELIRSGDIKKLKEDYRI